MFSKGGNHISSRITKNGDRLWIQMRVISISRRLKAQRNRVKTAPLFKRDCPKIFARQLMISILVESKRLQSLTKANTFTKSNPKTSTTFKSPFPKTNSCPYHPTTTAPTTIKNNTPPSPTASPSPYPSGQLCTLPQPYHK